MKGTLSGFTLARLKQLGHVMPSSTPQTSAKTYLNGHSITILSTPPVSILFCLNKHFSCFSLIKPHI